MARGTDKYVSPNLLQWLPTPLGTQFLLFQHWNIPITSPTPWGGGHPLLSLKKSTTEAQHYSLLRRATCENEVSGVLVFFFLSNLGSGRSAQGQGLAQRDGA